MKRLFLFVLMVALASTSQAQKSVIHTADQPLPPMEAAARMRVAEGIRVSLFAGEPDVMQPIGFCLDDRGRLWVAEAYNYPQHGERPGDRIVILEDSDGDGRHDQRTVFYEGLNYISGIEVGFGGVWVMSPPSMYFIADRDGDDVPDRAPKVLLDGFGTHANAHNIANGFAWGPDGWLYATHGRTNWSMIGKPGTPESERQRFDGGVWRYHPTRHVWEPFADGTTNPWGIDWNDYGDAFVCNCVNPHLFQVIQGAHYEPWRGRKSSEFAYQRIETIADHLHFVGLGNVRNGLGSQQEDTAGGGHAHCGTMIYLGDQFPDSYRNQLFTNNIHGRRINNDLLRPFKSGYIASHGPDLMRSEDPWFMGVTLAYGPGGEIYVSDWSDTGECHSVRNTRRHTGRIYRLTYLSSHAKRADLRDADTPRLVELQLHDNDWYVRHARRLLQERAAAGEDLRDAHRTLHAVLQSDRPTPKRLRALWALHVTDGINDQERMELLSDPDSHLRAWAVRLLCADRLPSPEAREQMRRLAAEGTSPRVRLAIASALQRLPLRQRWPIAAAMLGRQEDVEDPNLPLMNWYAIEPLIADDLDQYVELASRSRIPQVSENIARRIASSSTYSNAGMDLLTRRLAEGSEAASAIVTGMLIGLEGRRDITMPAAWPEAYGRLRRHANASLRRRAMRLALVFRDREAEQQLLAIAASGKSETEHRLEAIEALTEAGVTETAGILLRCLDEPKLRRAALLHLRRFSADEAPVAILSHYEHFDAEAKQFALQTLSSRPGWARQLIDAIEAGTVAKSDMTALTARQLASLGDESIRKRLVSQWGQVRETPRQRAKQISQLREMLKPVVLAEADLVRGKALFEKHCANCHRFFDKGGKIGPDLTGAQRTNLDYLLENIIDPSASVAEDYMMEMIQMADGRVISGLIESRTANAITIVTADQTLTLPAGEVERTKAAEVSLMPTGLLEPLSEREIRDLIGYLQR